MLRYAAVSRSPAAMRSEAMSRVQLLKSRVELLGFVRGFFGAVLLLSSSSCFVRRRRRSSSVAALVPCFVVARGCWCWSLVFVAVVVVVAAALSFSLPCGGSLVCGVVFPLSDLCSFTVILSYALPPNEWPGIACSYCR